jgi:hypothetical protein
MGALADGFMAYAQPLLDQTDGTTEGLIKALAIAQLCYNLALLPEESQEEALGKMQQSIAMDEKEFQKFREAVVVPMIRRHEEMFPRLHGWFSESIPPPPVTRITAATANRHAVTDRYAPCPCNSGKKFKFCCGEKRR